MVPLPSYSRQRQALVTMMAFVYSVSPTFVVIEFTFRLHTCTFERLSFCVCVHCQASSPFYVLPYIIWNFPHAEDMYIARVGFRGSILAPKAGTHLRRLCV